MPQFIQRDLTQQYISTSYQDVVQRYATTGSTTYLLDGLGYVIGGIPTSSIGGIILTQDQTASFAVTSSYAFTSSVELQHEVSTSWASESYHSTTSDISITSSYAVFSELSDTSSLSILSEFANTASLANNSITSISSSWASSSKSSSFTITSSYALNSFTASYITASNIDGIVNSSSYSITASWSPVPISASWASRSFWTTSGSFAIASIFSISASFASQSIWNTSSSFASRSIFSTSASWASASISSSYSLTSSYFGNGTNNYFPVWNGNNKLSSTSAIVQSGTDVVTAGTISCTGSVLIHSGDGDVATIYDDNNNFILRSANSTGLQTGQLRIVPTGGGWTDSVGGTYIQTHVVGVNNNNDDILENVIWMGGTWGADQQWNRAQFCGTNIQMVNGFFGDTPPPIGSFEVMNISSDNVSMIIRMIGSQTSDSFQVMDVNNGVLSKIDCKGNISCSIITASLLNGTSSWTKNASIVQVFSSSGNWYKPSNAKFVKVILWGGGGQGGGGAGEPTNITRSGGSGGGGGAYNERMFNALDLSSTESVTVGSGGNTGGQAGTNGVGSNGQGGGTTSFGTTPYFSAFGGGGGFAGQIITSTFSGYGGGGGGRASAGGVGQTSTAASAGGAPLASNAAPQAVGGQGASSQGNSEYGGAGGGNEGLTNITAAYGTSAAGGSSLFGGPGGGSGGGIFVDNVAKSGSAGGAPNSYIAGGGAGVNTSGSVGNSGRAGSGGGGGNGNASGTGSAGGPGGMPSAGGGGGGGGTAVGGVGGPGGSGMVVVITTF